MSHRGTENDSLFSVSLCLVIKSFAGFGDKVRRYEMCAPAG